MTTILNVSSASTREAAAAALRNAGFDVAVVEAWQQAAEALRRSDATLIVCDAKVVAEVSQAQAPAAAGLSREAARSLSHDLRTPLSAMAGWVHLLESGKLDEAGVRKVIGKLRGNIDDQVRTIERFLGNAKNEEKART